MSRRTKLLLKENNRAEKRIQNDGNRAVLTDITVYLRSANISPYYQEKVRRDICDMIADGEQRGESAKDIIGGDYKQFCDNVIEEIPKLGARERSLSLLRDILLCADVLLILWAVSNLAELLITAAPSLYFTVTAGNAVCGVLCISMAFWLFRTLSENAFDSDKYSGKKGFFILFFALVICMSANVFIKYPLFQIHAFAAAAAVVLLFALYKFLDAKLD